VRNGLHYRDFLPFFGEGGERQIIGKTGGYVGGLHARQASKSAFHLAGLAALGK
jgi:hypothetical protein